MANSGRVWTFLSVPGSSVFSELDMAVLFPSVPEQNYMDKMPMPRRMGIMPVRRL